MGQDKRRLKIKDHYAQDPVLWRRYVAEDKYQLGHGSQYFPNTKLYEVRSNCFQALQRNTLESNVKICTLSHLYYIACAMKALLSIETPGCLYVPNLVKNPRRYGYGTLCIYF